jgi:hypothetical protein
VAIQNFFRRCELLAAWQSTPFYHSHTFFRHSRAIGNLKRIKTNVGIKKERLEKNMEYKKMHKPSFIV